MMENQSGWRDFVSNKKSVLLLLVAAVISSALYAIYLQQRGELDTSYISTYWQEGEVEKNFNLHIGLEIYWFYLKKYLIVWLLGLIRFFIPIAVGVVFFDLFTYGFSIATMCLNYGRVGMFVAGEMFLLQGVILSVLLLELLDEALKRNQVFSINGKTNYIFRLIVGGIGCAVIMLIEIFIKKFS